MDAKYVLCINNEGYEVSLERRKIYRVLEEPGEAELDLIRVVDDSGEDYLYPRRYFVEIALPRAAEQAFVAA